MVIKGSYGGEYHLSDTPSTIGENSILYNVVDNEKIIVKIYYHNKLSIQLENRMKFMMQYKPQMNLMNNIAWPLDLIYNNDKFCGYVMPKLNFDTKLCDLFKHDPFKNTVSQQKKVFIAQSICRIISEIQNIGYIFGDLNPGDIGIDTKTCNVAFFGVDKYHIVINKSENNSYRCISCAEGYAAPELLHKCNNFIHSYPVFRNQVYELLPLDTFTKSTDSFALSVIIFQLLENGYYPYGKKEIKFCNSVTAPGSIDNEVYKDNYCFRFGNIQYTQALFPIELLSAQIAFLFARAFEHGRSDPTQRPSASEWINALQGYSNSLISCSKNSMHQHRSDLQECPYCKADDELIRNSDIYRMAKIPFISQSGSNVVSNNFNEDMNSDKLQTINFLGPDSLNDNFQGAANSTLNGNIQGMQNRNLNQSLNKSSQQNTALYQQNTEVQAANNVNSVSDNIQKNYYDDYNPLGFITNIKCVIANLKDRNIKILFKNKMTRKIILVLAISFILPIFI